MTYPKLISWSYRNGQGLFRSKNDKDFVNLYFVRNAETEEASKLYDENLLVRDRYISEVIEPLIKKHAPKSKEITLPMRDRFCVGVSINFAGIYSKDYINIELTNSIIKTLRENGYKIKHNCTPGTEYEDGEGTLTIYWD